MSASFILSLVYFRKFLVDVCEGIVVGGMVIGFHSGGQYKRWWVLGATRGQTLAEPFFMSIFILLSESKIPIINFLFFPFVFFFFFANPYF